MVYARLQTEEADALKPITYEFIEGQFDKAIDIKKLAYFEDYIVVSYLNDNQELNRRIFEIDDDRLILVSGQDQAIEDYFGTIQSYEGKFYLVVSGLRGDATYLNIKYAKSGTSGFENQSMIVELLDEYFIIIKALDNDAGYEFLISSESIFLDDNHQEIKP